MTAARAGIHEIMTSVGGALGVAGFTDVLGLAKADRYVVMVVDGLGLDLLREHADLAPFLSSLTNVEGVLAGIPSTTSVSLTSLGTGLLPGQHGMAGYTCRIPGTPRFLNTLTWDDRVDPEQWQPHPTVLRRLADAGVAATVVNDSRFERSGLTRVSQRGVPFIGADRSWDRLTAIAEAVEQGDRSVVYAYESAVDHTGHGHGVDSPEWRKALAEVDRDVADLREALPADAVLLVTADHGMVDVPMQGRFDLVDHPELRDDVVLVAGEARFRHVHTRSGAEETVAARWREVLGGRVEVRLRDDAQEWFGPLDPAVRGRFGDVVVAALDDFAVFASDVFSVELLLRGFHGSITGRERRIPVLVAS
ncbi:alkaline phosphatase family protein [Aeromicrobium senzhongii]|uniref:Alkaline phosphatase family protein n=1 Tax=Aeromicrobium senzhongii TaxID=2663859 RepID=A0ABX6SPE4_9ACTN|nr:nucleotide pyrophosphatase/phosphodiesterase family protein [Aeromicrobium senzhongii]MTB86926.1 alkaline phosphatase family protein [Aeromicrobium senzhongii]QNL93244.1 alkaline phosphatase family protein [Aeromicrobium senzhongii]